MEQSELERLAEKVNNLLNHCFDAEGNQKAIDDFNESIAKVALREAGVTSADLADESQENSPRVRHYWTLESTLRGKVLSVAAVKQSYYQGFDW